MTRFREFFGYTAFAIGTNAVALVAGGFLAHVGWSLA